MDPEPTPPKVVVTGGSGKIGQWVCQTLRDAGWRVYNFDLHGPEHRTGPYLKVDVSKMAEVYDTLAQVRPDAVVHLAANPSPYGHPRHQTFEGNVVATFNVMQAAGDLGIKRIVYGSSEMASGWSSTHTAPQRVPFDETDMTPPPNAYALSKYVGEVIASSIVAAHPETTIASLRINFVTQPAHMEWIGKAIASRSMSGTLWSYIDVRDVASAVLAALKAEVPGHRAYMIAACDALLEVPTREALRDRFGEAVEVAESLPEFGSCVDCSRIRTELGWTPTYSWRDLLTADVGALTA